MISFIVPYRPDDRRELLWSYAKGHVGRAMAEAQLDYEFVLGDTNDWSFNRSAARNNAFKKSSGDVIVVMDADTIIQRKPLAIACVIVEENPERWYVPYTTYFNLSKEYTEEVLNGKQPDFENPPYEHKISSTAGFLVMSRDAYLTVGGYNESFQGWGYEDNSFQLALDSLVSPHQRINGSVLHLWHEAPECDRFESPTISYNQDLHRRYLKAASGSKVAAEKKMRKLVDEYLYV